MADIILNNTSTLVGTYDEEILDIQSTTATTVLVRGLVATKVANKKYWTSGYLEYTITITNTTTIAYETPTFTDQLDESIVQLDTLSVTVNGATVPYTFVDGLLTIELNTIAPEETVVVSFRVEQA